MPGRSARLYEVRPDAGYVLGLDIGHKYVRGALADLAGGILARAANRSRASSVRGRVGELIRLADDLCAEAGIARSAVTQTVIGSPGVYDPRRNSMALTGGLPGWDRPAVLADLRAAFGHRAARGPLSPRAAQPQADPVVAYPLRPASGTTPSTWCTAMPPFSKPITDPAMYSRQILARAEPDQRQGCLPVGLEIRHPRAQSPRVVLGEATRRHGVRNRHGSSTPSTTSPTSSNSPSGNTYRPKKAPRLELRTPLLGDGVIQHLLRGPDG